jgi:hypothetical protein
VRLLAGLVSGRSSIVLDKAGRTGAEVVLCRVLSVPGRPNITSGLPQLSGRLPRPC